MVALLAAADRVDFSFVRDHVEVSDSVLSKQMSALEQAGYIKVKKGFVGKRPRTWLSLTGEGRRVFNRHLAALRPHEEVLLLSTMFFADEVVPVADVAPRPAEKPRSNAMLLK